LQSFFVDYLWLPFPSLEQNADCFFPHPLVSSKFYRQGHFMIPQSIWQRCGNICQSSR
jgi:hypothetical protein